MKLYDIPNKSRMRIEFEDGVKECLFHHPDGLYSYCTVNGEENGVFHLNMNTPMRKESDGEGDYYVINH